MAKTKSLVVSSETAIQEKFIAMRDDMNSSLIERMEEIDISLCAILCKQHFLMVGPPGVAKSLLVQTLERWITGSNIFTQHCCKDTSRNVAFGPMKISSLKLDKTERNLEGGAADATFVIMEEVK